MTAKNAKETREESKVGLTHKDTKACPERKSREHQEIQGEDLRREPFTANLLRTSCYGGSRGRQEMPKKRWGIKGEGLTNKDAKKSQRVVRRSLRVSAGRNEDEEGYVASEIYFAMGGAIFGAFTEASIRLITKHDLPGVEPYRGWLGEWLDRPAALKDLLDANGIQLITASNGGRGQSCEFIDPAKRAETVSDHEAFCRDFLNLFGCKHFKINMGRRPENGTTVADIKAIAETVTEIGKRTRDLGVTIAPHPHIWGPIERPDEVRALLDQTDPEIVSWIPDTAQLNLGGGDPVQLIDEYYDRLAAVHFKDSKARYRGYTGPTPTKEMHQEEILYKDLGAGGVGHPPIYKMLVDRGYEGWVTLDLDPPRANEGEGSVDEKIGINCRYLKETLHVPNL